MNTTTPNDATPLVRASPRTRTSGLRRRAFAKLWESMDGPVDEQIAPAKDDVFADMAGPIVEIGAGHGSNFSRYPEGTHVTAFEPNPYMAQHLADTASSTGIVLDHWTSDLRDAALPSGSVATVVSVLTLCSVPDRAELIAEIHRVLEPGGQFIFIEHIAETTNTRRRWFQRLVRPAWRALCDGCDPYVHTDQLIASAGFARVEATSANLGPGLDPTNLNHWGVATK